MNRYIIIQEGHPPFSTDYYDPENHEPADGSEQTVIDLATMKYRRNHGDNAGKWFHLEEDHL